MNKPDSNGYLFGEELTLFSWKEIGCELGVESKEFGEQQKGLMRIAGQLAPDVTMQVDQKGLMRIAGQLAPDVMMKVDQKERLMTVMKGQLGSDATCQKGAQEDDHPIEQPDGQGRLAK